MQPGATSPKRDEICKRSIGVVPHDEDEEFSKRQRYWHGAGPLSNSRIIVGRGHYRNAVASGRRVDTHNEQTRRYRVTVLTSSKTITLLFISLTKPAAAETCATEARDDAGTTAHQAPDIVGRGQYRNAVASGRRVDRRNEQTRRYRVTVLTSSKTITLLFISLTPASRRGNRRDGGRRRCRDNGASGARSSRCDSFRSSSRWGPGRGRSSLSTPTLCRGI